MHEHYHKSYRFRVAQSIIAETPAEFGAFLWSCGYLVIRAERIPSDHEWSYTVLDYSKTSPYPTDAEDQLLFKDSSRLGGLRLVPIEPPDTPPGCPCLECKRLKAELKKLCE